MTALNLAMNNASTRTGVAGLTLAALGVVFGDIGTSPLYTLQTLFDPAGGMRPTAHHVVGVISMIVWSLVVVVTLKYVVLIMRANNHGEGGIMALLALAVSSVSGNARLKRLLLVAGVFGAALFYGDGVITPAISVLSAVEGLKLVEPSLGQYVVEVTIVILVALFMLQRFGTAGIGRLFGPVMAAWFLVLAVSGVSQVVRNPAILSALDPTAAVDFAAGNPWLAFVALGSVVLALTGAEALYADMGHFGAGPVRLSWFVLVLPALALNYLGQGALLLAQPSASESPFYRMFPGWALVPMVVLATISTVIASQAVITGAFSMTKQAIQLGYLPRMRIIHTSESEAGQIYLPAINRALLFGVLGAVLAFKSSAALGAAYGIAVTGTMLITTSLTFFVVHFAWKMNLWLSACATALFFAIDLVFFSSNLMKVIDGGWFPLVIGAAVFTVMVTWKRGRELLAETAFRDAVDLKGFVREVIAGSTLRVDGTAVYLNGVPEHAPIALLHNLKHNHVFHRQNIFVNVSSEEIPRVVPNERAVVDQIAEGCWEVALKFGFKDDIDLPGALGVVTPYGASLDAMTTSYFLSRSNVVSTKKKGMARWRENLFANMQRNASSAADFLKVPDDRVVELGAKVLI